LVDPEDEHDVGNAQFKVQTDGEIVAAVRYKEAVARGDVMEVDSEEEEEDEPEGEPDLTTAEMLSLCQKLEKACLRKDSPIRVWLLLIISVASVQMNNGRSFWLRNKLHWMTCGEGRLTIRFYVVYLARNLRTRPIFSLVVTKSLGVTLRDKSENA
jgi:hypothetical protein